MLEINVNVVKGIMFIDMNGELSKNTMSILESEINYLVYKQGMMFFVFNFNNLNKIDNLIFERLQNKLVEIFLRCGKVAICGLDNFNKKLIGFHDKLFYVNNERDAFEYLVI